MFVLLEEFVENLTRPCDLAGIATSTLLLDLGDCQGRVFNFAYFCANVHMTYET